MKWEEGRQGSGYYKMKLLESKLFKFDVYLLKFPKESFIMRHTDPAPDGYEHHRLNVILNQRFNGGIFYQNDTPATKSTRIIKFRPDLLSHRVSRVTAETRYVLSVGWLNEKS